MVSAGAVAAPAASVPNPADPFEPFNRHVASFNDGLDAALLMPVATAYRRVLPAPVRTGVGNFFGNLGDAWNLANCVFQLKLQASAQTFMRLNVNTLLGLGGLLDIASELGIERHREDFGQTLGRWGVGSGPYLVLPVLGPSSVRDAAALPVDLEGDALGQAGDVAARNALQALRLADVRAGLLPTTDLLDQVALDKYAFTRDAWLQKRRNDVYDGDPPPER